MLADAMRVALEQQAWTVDWLADAADASLALLDHGYAAVLLDLGLPNGSGLDVLQTLRGRYDATPVLIVTARDKLSERIRGLDAGADDYIVKPLQLDELCARLRAVMRRSQGRVSPVLSCREVRVDPAQRLVTLRDRRVTLSRHEYRTLVALMERQGRTVTREQLLAAVYGDCGAIDSNTIAVYVHQLRRKLGEDLIVTDHGVGYRMGDERVEGGRMEGGPMEGGY